MTNLRVGDVWQNSDFRVTIIHTDDYYVRFIDEDFRNLPPQEMIWPIYTLGYHLEEYNYKLSKSSNFKTLYEKLST